MSKNKSKQDVLQDSVSSSVVLHNWDEWFQNCGTLTSDLKTYESYVQEYFKKQNPNTSEGKDAAGRAFEDQHVCKFFEKQLKLPGWMVTKALIRTGIGFLAVFVVMLLVFVLQSEEHKLGQPVFIKSAICAVLGGALIGWFLPVIHMMQINKLCKKMTDLEVKLRTRIGFLPPKYRNSQATDTFYNLFCNYGIVTFNQAVQACDDYLISNNMIGAYMSVMFDVPYENTINNRAGEGSSSDRGLYTGGSNHEANPNLPDDIAMKTFKGTEDADKKLASLVGLESVKQQVRQMKNRMDFYDNGKNDRISGNHMVFLGPPGTGKTTIARIITKILYDFGYIKENKCVEIDGGYLKSPYQGQTTERANAIIQYAMGGVLFIDEAYLLYDEKGGPGTEAAGVLLKAMEDHKTDFVVIMAGYEDNINRLLASNEGFASRIKYKVYFDNFSVQELVKIFELQLEEYSSDDYHIEVGAVDLLRSHFAKELRVPGFGNARVVRNTLDCIMDNHADHYMKHEIPEDKKYVITSKDVSAYIEVRSKQMQEDGRNFIASRNLDSSVISLQELKGKTKAGSEDPDKDLNALTGLDVVKKEITQMKQQFAFYDGKMETEGNHMVFVGPPGTGKTTVASIMTGYLYQLGLIDENSYLDVNGDFLRGMYLGHTGKRMEAIVQYAQGMVLFIDEAYLLCGTDGGTDQFGQEAVGVLLDAMEKYRKNFVVIFAGYEREMNAFLDLNSGLRSRINLEFHFESYSPYELAQMLKNVGNKNGFKFEKDVWKPVQLYFKGLVQDPKFGNGRFVRQFFESCKKQHISNYAAGMYSEDKKHMITLQDIQDII